MGFYFAKPSRVLSPFVKQYWGLDDCLKPGEEHVQRIVPNGLMDLTFYLGDKPQLINHSQQSLENAVLAGHSKRPHDLIVTGNMQLFAVSFNPLGASAFFDLPMNELFECIVPLRFILKEKIDRLEDELSGTTDFTGKVGVVEDFLLKQLAEKGGCWRQKRMQESIALINESIGMVDVDALAASACLSRKQYERNFQEMVGASPKQFMRIVRFQYAIHYKSRYPQASLTGVACECGFFDQSHMISEFRDFSGLTPKQYFAECEPFSDYFSE